MHTPAPQLTSSSERQYKYRFPGLKNVKEDEWAYIEEEIRSRAAVGKLSLPCLHDQPLPMSRTAAELLAPELRDPASPNNPQFVCSQQTNMTLVNADR